MPLFCIKIWLNPRDWAFCNTLLSALLVQQNGLRGVSRASAAQGECQVVGVTTAHPEASGHRVGGVAHGSAGIQRRL